MKKLLSILMLSMFLFVSIVGAAPFVGSDQGTPSQTHFLVEEGGVPIVESETVNNAVRHDLDGITAGEHTYTYKFGVVWQADAFEGDPLIRWGDASVPFWLKKPDAPQIPVGLLVVEEDQ